MEEDDKGLARLVLFAGRVAKEVITTVLPALLIALLVHAYVAEAVAIEDGPSMQPNLYVGDRLMTEKISYHLHPPRRGDVVIIERPAGEVSLVKRVVAVEGEVVEVRDGHTFVNGQPIDEPWVAHFGGQDYGPALVPPGHLFVVGDNRAVSRDSRAIGPVTVDSIQGRVWLVYWPPEQFEFVP